MARSKKIQALLNSDERIPRGAASRDRQLSKLQKTLLLWLAKRESEILINGKENEVLILKRKGIPWKPKKFYEEHSIKKQSVSRMLTELEGRNLVVKFDSSKGDGLKPRTSHVRITDSGIDVIAMLYLLGDSDRGYREAIRKAKKAGEGNPQLSALEGKGMLGPKMSLSTCRGLTELLHIVPNRRRIICNFVSGSYDFLIRNMSTVK